MRPITVMEPFHSLFYAPLYVALGLGYASIYNHSYQPNARYVREQPDVLEFHAIADIKADEEITINYHGEPGDKRPVDFDVH